MRTVPNLSKSDGFTLVEIIVASGILMVLALLISSMLYNSNKHQAKLEQRARDVDFLQNTALNLRMNPIPTPN